MVDPAHVPERRNISEALFRAQVERTTEVLKSLSALSTEVLKALLLINGGAIVAILAYAGTAAPQSRAATGRAFALPMLGYVFGVVFAVLSLGYSYFTQLRFFNTRVNDESNMAAKAMQTGTPERAYDGPSHRRALKAAQVFGVLSVGCFLLGSIGAAIALWCSF